MANCNYKLNIECGTILLLITLVGVCLNAHQVQAETVLVEESTPDIGVTDTVTTKTLRVQIEEKVPLDFGLIRFQRRSAGWVVIDPGGGISTSDDIAFSRKSLPGPGQVRISAPPDSVLLLSLEFEGDSPDNSYSTSEGAVLRSPTMGRGMQLLPRNGRYWELQTPSADSDEVEVILSIGGELQFTKFSSGRQLKTKLRLECVSIETQN